MTLTQEVRGSLSRCLSQENIIVEHRNVDTASFDVERRILTLPNWKKASNTVFQLLILHECAHACFTDNIDWREQYPEVPKDFVNVVEDARIERLMKKKYPGSARTFFRGYQELNAEDFFCVKDTKYETLSLIDRINLYFKIGAFHQIPFNDDEEEFLTQISLAETFDDVLRISQSLYEYVNEKKEQQDVPSLNSSSESNSSGEEGENEEQEGENDAEQNQETEENQNSESKQGNEKDLNDEENEGVSDENAPSNGGIQPDQSETNELESKTSRSFDEKAKQLNDKLASEVAYVEIPEFDLNYLVIPNSHIHNLCDKYYSNPCPKSDYDFLLEDYPKFKKSAEREVSYLVKEFECKKSADQYARATTAKTGILDTSKLHTYKYNDDLFRKVSVLPDGKNHGLIFIFDWSGSMCDYLLDTYKQLCSLIWFCRKVSIPFEVYSFTSEVSAYMEYDANHTPTYEPKENFLMPEKTFRLMNILTSQVNNRELEKQMKMLWVLCSSYQKRYGYVPNHMQLSGTPLGESMMAMNQIVPQFVSRHKVQKANVVFLTDGEGYNNPHGYNKTYYSTGEEYVGAKYNRQTVLRNRKNGRMYPAYNDRDFSGYAKVLMTYLKDAFPYVNFINFRIAASKELSGCYQQYGDSNVPYDKVKEQFRKEKFVSFTTSGFDKFFVLSSNSVNVDTEFEVEENATKAKIKNAFAKSLNNKKANKKVLNEFITLVS
jgi:hypothetical protein